MDHSMHGGHGGMDHSVHDLPTDHVTTPEHAEHAEHADHADHVPGSYHLMQMSFHFGFNETVLVEAWRINSYASLIASMIAVFILATLYEGLKCYRDYLSWRVLKSQDYHAIRVPGEANVEAKEVSSAEASIGSHRVSDPSSDRTQMPGWFHCVQTVLHVLQVTVSMLLMLIFMTYNGWLCLSVIAGAGFGYFMFGWRRHITSSDARQHCH